MRRAWFMSALALWSCPSDPARVPEGSWGGQHAKLEVTAEGGQIEFDCAHGRIQEPLALDGEGRFDLAGVLVRERGGPQRVEGEEETPARYLGTMDGGTLELKVDPSDGGGGLGPFRLVRGQTPRLVKCL